MGPTGFHIEPAAAEFLDFSALGNLISVVVCNTPPLALPATTQPQSLNTSEIFDFLSTIPRPNHQDILRKRADERQQDLDELKAKLKDGLERTIFKILLEDWRDYRILCKSCCV